MLVFTRNSNSKLFKVRTYKQQRFTRYYEVYTEVTIYFMCGTYVYYHTYKEKKQVNEKNKVFKENSIKNSRKKVRIFQ